MMDVRMHCGMANKDTIGNENTQGTRKPAHASKEIT